MCQGDTVGQGGFLEAFGICGGQGAQSWAWPRDEGSVQLG